MQRETQLLHPFESVPQAEVDCFRAEFAANLWRFDPSRILPVYEAANLRTIPDRESPEVVELILGALAERRPYSVIRLGDGEVNLLTFGHDPRTPTLERHLVEAILQRYVQRFVPTGGWFDALREGMRQAIAAADVVGVPGISPIKPQPAEQRLKALERSFRGWHGQYRAREVLPALAATGAFSGKVIASAHLYLGVAYGLYKLIEAAERILLLTSMPALVERLRAGHPGKRIDAIATGAADSRCDTARHPFFLAETYAALPLDLTSTLCLIGAGAWAEFYCTWIRQRGGVAVDIGSGFDLLDGRITRPIHKAFPEETLARLRRIGGQREDAS